MIQSQKILLVEDDPAVSDHLRDSLIKSRKGLEVHASLTVIECLTKLQEPQYDPVAVIVDLNLPSGVGGDEALGEIAGDYKGFKLAKKIRAEYPHIKIFGMTSLMDRLMPECECWFRESGDPETGIGVYHKHSQWVLLRHRIWKLTGQPSPVKVFIVHGHDLSTRDELRSYAEDLNFDVEILGEGLSQGRTWIERIEKSTNQASLAWVLFSPDEWGMPLRIDVTPRRRPRPNVLLECGYVLGAFGRLSSRVLLFQKGDVELPSDLDGIARVDLQGAVKDEHEKIVRELRPWL